MIRKKIFLATAILLIFVAVFGVGASAYASVAETRYADAPVRSPYASEIINYTSKEVTEENYTFGRCPMFTGTSDLDNACGAIAGAEIVAFYDRYFPELIPDWTPYFNSNLNYRWQDDVVIPALIHELYTLMRTNVDDVGVSRTDFLNGLTSYVTGKGYQINYQSVKSGNSLNYQQCKNAIDNNKVIVLFVNPTTVYTLTEANGYDALAPKNITGAHIMLAFGYLQIKYYNANGLFRTDTSLCIATGRDDFPLVFYKIDSTTTNYAYIVNVQ